MRCIQLLVMLLMFHTALCQVGYVTSSEKPVEKYRTVDVRQIRTSDGFIQHLVYPKPGGDAYHEFLLQQKQKATQLFPDRGITLAPQRSLVDPPQLLDDFSGNSWTAGIPLDNHLAVNTADQIVSVVNTHMLVVGPTGVWQDAIGLDEFWSPVGEDDFYFDPRVIYDPLEDRYIMAMMQDGECGGSNIVFAFSASADPAGTWHLYQFSGCPRMDSTFADFPMIALTDEELFFTYNAVYQDSTWQTGFLETFIYQIDKHDGYAGEQLDWRSWQDIMHDGHKLRYICPVKYATAEMASETYFLSNRSFDIENDTIFLVHINGDLEAPDLELTVRPLISDQSYGVPPNARQPKDYLQTNDARVLDAFYVDDHIQFVSNTMDFASGKCAVYHGIIYDVSDSPVLTGQIIQHESEHFAYPGIAYTGEIPGDRDAIIVAAHASENRFPGYSALYYNNGYSDWTTVKEGLRNIDMLKVDNPFGLDPTLERWGDYSGIQRQYHEVGTVWTSSCYGKPGSVNETWIGYVSKPGIASAASHLPGQRGSLNAFPNPAREMITFEVRANARGKLFEAVLHDVHGALSRTVFTREISQEEPFRFFYNCSVLPPGTYILQMVIDGAPLGSKKIIVQ